MSGKVKVNENGSELAYIDSGKPSGSTYKTLVCIHGHTYHAQIFSRLFAHAEQENLRIIALNRRDYIGSSAFTDSELSALHSSSNKLVNDFGSSRTSSQRVTEFLRDRGLEIARFLVWIIEELHIPPISDTGADGGLALLGWSLGNITSLAFLANLRSYPEYIINTLEPYLRTFVMYELPDNSLGYASPEGSYHPLDDKSIPERIRGITTGKWIASYYAHPAYSTSYPRISDSQDTVTSTGVFVDEGDSTYFSPQTSLQFLQIRTPKPKEALRASTLESFTARDFVQCADTKPHERSDKRLMRLPLGVLRDQVCRALFAGSGMFLGKSTQFPDFGSGLSTMDFSDDLEMILPKVKVQVVFGLASYWAVQWETWQLKKEIDAVRMLNYEGMDILARPVSFLPVPGENHFMHWDNPKKFAEICADII